MPGEQYISIDLVLVTTCNDSNASPNCMCDSGVACVTSLSPTRIQLHFAGGPMVACCYRLHVL